MAKYKSWFKPIVKFVKYEPRIYFEAEPDERGIALSRYDKLIEAFDKLNHHCYLSRQARSSLFCAKNALFMVLADPGPS
jgi:hypothetical protein